MLIRLKIAKIKRTLYKKEYSQSGKCPWFQFKRLECLQLNESHHSHELECNESDFSTFCCQNKQTKALTNSQVK